MSYITLKQLLMNEFTRQNFRPYWEEGEGLKAQNNGRNPNIKQLQYTVTNAYRENLVLNFPGYKTGYDKYGEFKYDYQVNLNNISVSHVNVIVDLYNKAIQAPQSINLLKDFITRIAYEGDGLNIDAYVMTDRMNITPPTVDLLQLITETHRRLGKPYLQRGNENWNYTIQQLSAVIPLIVLQEDINYPMPRYAGRRMSFYRYYEALYCAQNNTTHNITEVIERALKHGKPPELWNNCIDYTPIINIVNSRDR